MISGMYMGELIRQVLIDLMKDDLIFLGLNREPVNSPQLEEEAIQIQLRTSVIISIKVWNLHQTRRDLSKNSKKCT